MGLVSFFKRSAAATPASGAADDPRALEAARLRARRRLIGAVVLLGIGVIAFPLLFETQPRPIPVDIAIEIPKREGAAPLAVPSAPAASRASIAAAPVAVEPRAEPVAVPKAEPRAEPKAAATRVDSKPEPPVEARPAPKAAEPVPSRPAAVAVAAAASAAGRFVVQVGAFADAASARGARNKVEQLGLHTYTQSVDTEGGKRTRVRLGPFSTRDEADKAAAKVRAAGLPAAVLTL